MTSAATDEKRAGWTPPAARLPGARRRGGAPAHTGGCGDIQQPINCRLLFRMALGSRDEIKRPRLSSRGLVSIASSEGVTPAGRFGLRERRVELGAEADFCHRRQNYSFRVV